MPKSRVFLRIDGGTTSVEDVFERFIRHCKVKNLSERTIETYEYNFKRFKKFLDEQGISDIKDITSEVIEEFTLYLQEIIDNPVSVNTILRNNRTFLNYAMRNRYMDKFTVHLIKAEKKIKETYSDEELKILLEKPDLNTCGFADYRTWVIINWILSTGNRIRTIRNVKIRDLDFDNGVIILRKTKNKNQQIIPMSRALANILREYLEYRGGEPEDYLFCNIYGQKLSTSAIVSAIRRYNLKRGVEKTSAHLLRHIFAKKWILNGGDMFRLQKILGHSSLEMVKGYVNIFSNDLKSNFEEFNPLNQFIREDTFIKLR